MNFFSPLDKKSDVRLFIYLIVVIVFGCFYNVLGNGFVWDDALSLVENPHYRGLSGSHLSWMFKTFHDANYHPLVWVSFGLDYVLWGMNPAGYHLTNLVWHIINSVLFFHLITLFVLSDRLPNDIPHRNTILACSTAGTLFFAIHPLRVENIAWLSARADLMCAAFYMLTVMSYLKYVKTLNGKRKWYIYTLIFFIFSLLSRAWGVTLPIILLIIDAYPLRRLNWEKVFTRSNMAIILEKIPLIIFSIDAGYLALLAKSQRAGMLNLDQHSWLDRIMQSAYGLIFYLWKTLIPIRLSPLYILDQHFNPFETQYIISALLVMAILIGLLKYINRLPGLAICFLCYTIIVSPVLGIVQVGPQVAADRYTYISCLPFGILVGAGLYRFQSILKKKRHDVMVSAALLSLLTSFFFLSTGQSKIWHDENSLWTHAISVNRDNYVAYWNRGLFFDDQKNYEGALKDYSNAIRCNPTDDKYYNNRGAIRKMQGNIQEALEDFNNAIKINPKSPEPYANRATIHASRSNLKQALHDYQKALEVAPQNWEQRKTVEILLSQIMAGQKNN
jgi:protein O-mannosyl-transferase